MIDWDGELGFMAITFVVIWICIGVVWAFGIWGAIFLGTIVGALVLGSLARDAYIVSRDERNHD